MRDEPFLSLFMGLRRHLRLLSHKFLKDEDDISDALQDAFCRLWARRNELHTDEQAKAVTLTTVRNLCIDRLRQQKHFTDMADEDVQQLPDDSREEAFERHDRFEQVRQVVESHLTEMQRKVFLLKEVDGLDTEEVADRLGCSPEAVRMHLSRIRKTIRECFRQRN